jgi:hypothetical protein
MRSVDRPLRVTLELDIEGSSVRGFARDSQGRELPFAGWLGLVGALDRLRVQAAEPPDRAPHQEEKP